MRNIQHYTQATIQQSQCIMANKYHKIHLIGIAQIIYCYWKFCVILGGVFGFTDAKVTGNVKIIHSHILLTEKRASFPFNSLPNYENLLILSVYI